ncbi:MAG: FAD-binding protein, partial [Planctomycetota bacterium]
MVDNVQTGIDPTRDGSKPLVQELADVDDLDVHPGEPMATHTTFGIGGPVTAWVDAPTSQALATVLKLSRRHATPVMVLGGGSNVLFDDQAMDLVVVHPVGRLASMQWHDDCTVTVGAGCPLVALMNDFR